MAFINSGSLVQARQQSKIKLGTYRGWMANDEHFQKMFAIVKSPLAFMSLLSQAIIYRAALEHYKLLGDDRVSVKQWSIERAYNIVAAQQQGKKSSDDEALDQAAVKRAIERAKPLLDQPTQDRLNRQPFAFVEGESRVIEETSAEPA